MNAVGDLTIVFVSAGMALLFQLLTRRMGRAKERVFLLNLGLIVLAIAALADSAEHLPGWPYAQGLTTAVTEGAAYGLYTIAGLILAAGFVRWIPMIARIDAEVAARSRAESDLQG
ncbi:MAG: hypothetical protein ACOC0V_04165, partial [Oceanicaulis sp.]